MPMNDRIYADHAATSPMTPRVLAVLTETAAEVWGNPSSLHGSGRAAKEAVEAAREKTAALLGCLPEEVVFTSGGTESDNWAITEGLAEGVHRGLPEKIVTTAIEHPAVLEPVKAMERRGVRAVRIGCGGDGRIRLDELEKELAYGAALVSVMAANNETGVIQPIPEAVRIVRRLSPGTLFHCDAVQAAGHVRLNVKELDVDLVSVSGHKLCAPKGIGALYIRKETGLKPYLRGGGQEGGLRSGTEAVPLIAAFGEACAEAAETLDAEAARLTALRDRIYAELLAEKGAVELGERRYKMPGTVDIAFENVGGEALMLLCDLLGLELSTGSACHAGSEEPSHVLTARGVGSAFVKSAIRISLGRSSGEREACEAVRIVKQALNLIRNT